MTDPAANRDHDTDTGTRLRSLSGSPPSTPRWVKVLAIIVLVLVAAFVILHLAGGGFGSHAPLVNNGAQFR